MKYAQQDESSYRTSEITARLRELQQQHGAPVVVLDDVADRVIERPEDKNVGKPAAVSATKS